jgi:hypothetical protein
MPKDRLDLALELAKANLQGYLVQQEKALANANAIGGAIQATEKYIAELTSIIATTAQESTSSDRE